MTCFSRRHAEALLTPDSPLSAGARSVLRAMLEAGSIGPRRAIKQAALASRSGVSPREIQEANLELLAQGIPVCTSCGGGASGPAGQYIAESAEQIEPYADQLHGRGVLCLQHAARLRSAARVGAGIVAAERAGQGTLWGDGPSHLNTPPSSTTSLTSSDPVEVSR